MPSNKKQKAAVKDVAPRIYDMIMVHIEPDLTTDRLPVLTVLYAGETPEAHTARMARYDRAYDQCENVIATLETRMHDEVRNAKKKTKQEKSHAEKEEKEKQIETLEEMIDSPNTDA